MELIKKFISIIVLVFLCFSNSFANQDEIKKMIKKNENYNLGLSKKDDTILIKIIGDSKEKIEKEAMKTCKDKSESTVKDSCYIHYSAIKSQY